MSATSSMRVTSGNSEVVQQVLHQMIERVGDGGAHLARQMCVARGGARTTMAQKLLNQPQVNTRLQQVRRIRMPQRVHMGALPEATGLPGRVKRILHTATSHRTTVMGQTMG